MVVLAPSILSKVKRTFAQNPHLLLFKTGYQRNTLNNGLFGSPQRERR